MHILPSKPNRYDDFEYGQESTEVHRKESGTDSLESGLSRFVFDEGR